MTSLKVDAFYFGRKHSQISAFLLHRMALFNAERRPKRLICAPMVISDPQAGPIEPLYLPPQELDQYYQSNRPSLILFLMWWPGAVAYSKCCIILTVWTHANHVVGPLVVIYRGRAEINSTASIQLMVVVDPETSSHRSISAIGSYRYVGRVPFFPF